MVAVYLIFDDGVYRTYGTLISPINPIGDDHENPVGYRWF
jgi:hypothetical protein